MQAVALTAVNEGWLDGMPLDDVRQVVERLAARARMELPDLMAELDAGRLPSGEWSPQLAGLIPPVQSGEAASAP